MAVALECGDLVEPLEQGLLRWHAVVEPGDVASGKRPGRRSPEEVTLFESQGVAMEDLAVAARGLARAREQGTGQEIPL